MQLLLFSHQVWSHSLRLCGLQHARLPCPSLSPGICWNAVLGCSLINDDDLSSFPRQTTQHHSNPSLCCNHWCQRSWSLSALWRPTRPSRTSTKKRCPFHHRRWQCKSRKSRDTQDNRQVRPWNTKGSRAKANRVCQEVAPVTADTLFQQHRRRLFTWKSPDGQHWRQVGYVLCGQSWRRSMQFARTNWSWLWLRSSAPYWKFELKLKEAGKTARPFRCDLSRIPYDLMSPLWRWQVDSRNQIW